MTQAPKYSIFIPTYNRGYILHEALASLDRSRCRDFEVVIVDDGSTDDTATVVERWSAQTDVPVIYQYQRNQGKHVAHNRAVKIARGELFINLDSDDQLLPDALDELAQEWRSIAESDRTDCAGICGLCTLAGGALFGEPFARRMDSDFLSIRTGTQLRGEKRWALRTDVLRDYPYPVFAGERHSRPFLILNRLSHQYRVRFVNLRMIQVGHAPDGISVNRKKIQRQNPQAYRQYFLEEINLHFRQATLWQRLSYYQRYIKYSLLSGVPTREQQREVRSPLLWAVALPSAWLAFKRDIKRRSDGSNNFVQARA